MDIFTWSAPRGAQHIDHAPMERSMQKTQCEAPASNTHTKRSATPYMEHPEWNAQGETPQCSILREALYMEYPKWSALCTAPCVEHPA